LWPAPSSAQVHEVWLRTFLTWVRIAFTLTDGLTGPINGKCARLPRPPTTGWDRCTRIGAWAQSNRLALARTAVVGRAVS